MAEVNVKMLLYHSVPLVASEIACLLTASALRCPPASHIKEMRFRNLVPMSRAISPLEQHSEPESAN